MSEQALKQCSSLALAHMGDSVYELMTRGYLIHSGLVTNKNLHRKTIHLVCAGEQAAGAQAILPMLTEDEQTIFRHGRNAKPKSTPKSSSVAEYALATAGEALFGWLAPSRTGMGRQPETNPPRLMPQRVFVCLCR